MLRALKATPPWVTLWLVGTTLALGGLTNYTDGIVRYVIGVVDPIDWWALWKPAFDPPPMNTYTYRPLTVLSVKLELLLGGRDPFWMTVLHLPVVPWLGLAAHRFLRTHGLAEVAMAGALTSMALPSMLFSGWIPVESDTMGAAFLCEMGRALQMWRHTGRRKYLWLLLAFAFGVATTKETSAAAGFGYLAAAALAYRKDDFVRLSALTFGYGVVLLILITPLILAKGQQPHEFHVQSQGFSWGRAGWMLVHNAAQIFYVTSSAGAALILLGAWRPSGRARSVALLLAVCLLLSLPPLRVYNHYESVIIDQVDWVLGFAAVLLLGLVVAAVRPSTDPLRRHLVLASLFLPCVLIVAPIIALQSRPDVSARLYAPVVPIFAGLAWQASRELRMAPMRLDRALAWIMTICLGAFPISGVVNAVQTYRARMNVESVAKERLAYLLRQEGVRCPFVVAINRNHELAIEELRAFGVSWDECSALFVPNRIHLDPADEDLSNWRVQGHRYSLLPAEQRALTDALLAGQAPEQCAYLYLQGQKATMETRDYRTFAGDFEWAWGNLPEFDQEMYEQQVELQFREQTGYQKLFARAGARQELVEEYYELLPLNLNEAVRRLLLGLPVIEGYAYEGRILFLQGCIIN